MIRPKGSLALAVAAVAFAAVVVAGCGSSSHKTSASSITATAAPAFSAAEQEADPGANWIVDHGNLAEQAHSSLTQVNPSNVSKLGLAWTTTLNGSCDDSFGCGGEGNALVYDGVQYLITGADDIFAINGATGKHLWEYQPSWPAGFVASGQNEGVSRGLAMGAGNLYTGQLDGDIAAVNMTTGKQVWSTSLGLRADAFYFTAAPVYYDGMVLIGATGGDSGSSDFIAALSASTGKLLWKWNQIPSPGQPGFSTWNSNTEYLHGGGATWDAVSIDPSLGYLYVGTGNPEPWNERPKGNELYTDSLVALNIHTGKLVWYFQTVHHDIWDDDIPSSPVLFNAKFRPYKIISNGTFVQDPAKGSYGGKLVGAKVQYTGPAVEEPAVAVASKMGFLFIFNRKTGQPLIPTVEAKVPTGDPSLNLSPTQPIPVGDAFAATCVEPSQWNYPGPNGKPVVHGCTYSPYGIGTFVAVPHDEGEWMPASFDAATNTLDICTINNRAWAFEALPPAQMAASQVVGAGYSGINNDEGERQGYTGSFTAMNVSTDKISWQDNEPDFCYSGMTTTASGLAFVGRNDGTITALQASTGEQLWRSSAPTTSPGANSPVITYMVDGKQYVSVYVAGNDHENTPRGDLVYTYVLGGKGQFHNVTSFLPAKPTHK